MSRLVHNLIFAVTSIAISLTIISYALLLLGIRPFILQSASMEPLYPKGSLVWINTRTSIEEVLPGDVIAYRTDQGITIMHRVIAIYASADPSGKKGQQTAASEPSSLSDGSNTLYVTMRGDANKAQETVTLTPSNYLGRAVFFLPRIGKIISNINRIPQLLWLLCGGLLAAAFLPARNHTSLNVKEAPDENKRESQE